MQNLKSTLLSCLEENSSLLVRFNRMSDTEKESIEQEFIDTCKRHLMLGYSVSQKILERIIESVERQKAKDKREAEKVDGFYASCKTPIPDWFDCDKDKQDPWYEEHAWDED